MTKKNVLIVSPTCYPDVGGVETHLFDLFKALSKKRDLDITVATFKPIVTSGVKKYKKKEVFENITIYRFWWLGGNFFHFFEKYPVLQFLYLCPYLLIRTFGLLLFSKRRIDIIHGQGLTGAWVGMVLKKIFKKKLIVSTHTVYKIKKSSLVARLIKNILNQANEVLCLSEASRKELISFGINCRKLSLYKQWVDLDFFKPINKNAIREALNVDNKFTVLFVGRLIKMKGVEILCEVAKKNPDINFLFVGDGPLRCFLAEYSKKYKNIFSLGRVDEKIYKYYNLGDVFCLPSQEEEGFGRVIMEALACGIPVLGSNKGGIPEAVNKDVAVIVEPTVDNLDLSIKNFYGDQSKLWKMKKKTRKYAVDNFSSNNIDLITKHY